ncbi:hypothetical protein OESDEN_07087 [Oesophagostomum dentatum]|uniref:Neurotransmitter-gated ion-channel transmembrane domain-containing protein n=1 Tax=Oesophagostomum dentatum TaxID=61180 RepID=A0A0B1TA23_OESDE|nr:hypothetical protein OESDEN_07087 [Oesophagostomum dentatum]
MPTIITCLLTLCSFWIDTPSMAISLLIFNVLLQGLFGWDLIRELPPGSGSIPKIVSLYGFNLSMTTIAFMINVLAQFFESVLPKDLELPDTVSALPEKLRLGQLFQVKGLSFDPQLLLNYNAEEDPAEFNSPLCSIEPTNALEEEDNKQEEKREGDHETLIAMESESPSTVISLSPVPPNVQPSPVPAEEEDVATKTSQSIYLVRRIFFCVFFLMYIIAVPVCLI